MAEKKENPHKGHRQRMREELWRLNNLDAIEPHRLLEVLLFTAIPRKDTNPIAHALIEEFGGIAGVLDANVEDLAAVKGMTKNAAILIKTVMPLARRYKDSKIKKGYAFENIEEMCEFLVQKHLGIENEVFMVTCFDVAGKWICSDILTKGTPDAVEVSLREVVACIFKHNSPCVVVSHNHRGESCEPSQADIKLTIELSRTLSQLQITLLDHVIVSDNDYKSLRRDEKYSAIFK